MFLTSPKLALYDHTCFVSAGRYYITCDHFRSTEFFIESIKPFLQPRSAEDPMCVPFGVVCRDWETFEQGRCADCSHQGDCAIMGYNSNVFFQNELANTKREFYLKTSEEKPFCCKYTRVELRNF